MPASRRPVKEHPAVAAVRRKVTARSRSRSATSTASCAASSIPRRQVRRRDGAIRRRLPGSCDVVFGWDAHDQCYDNTTLTGWQQGAFPTRVALDLDTTRRVPWDINGVPFFLGDFVNPDGSAFAASICRSACSRGRDAGLQAHDGHGVRVVQLRRDAAGWAAKRGVARPITPGMFGYSLLRMGDQRGFFNALMGRDGGVRRADRRPAHGDRASVYEAAIAFDGRSRPPTARSCSRPAPRGSASASA